MEKPGNRLSGNTRNPRKASPNCDFQKSGQSTYRVFNPPGAMCLKRRPTAHMFAPDILTVDNHFNLPFMSRRS